MKRDRLLLRYAAAAVGLLFLLPHLIRPFFIPEGTRYTAFGGRYSDALSFDETILYGSQANYVARTLRPPFDAGLFEYGNVVSVVPTVPYYAAAPVVRILGSTDRAFVLLDVVLPTLAFLLFVQLLRLCRIRLVPAMSLALLALVPFQAPRNTLQSVLSLAGLAPAGSQPLEYSRFIAPSFSFTLLVLGALFLIRGRSWRGGVLAGICGAAMFYTYLFTWVAFLPGACLIFLRRSIHRGPEGARFRPDVASGTSVVVMLLLGIPFALQYLAFARGPGYAGVTERMLWTIGRWPDRMTILNSVVIASVTALGWWLARRRSGIRELLLIVVGGLVAYNGQLVLGRTMEAFHLPNRFFQPFLVLSFGAALVSWPGRGGAAKVRRAALGVGIAVMTVAALRQAEAAYKGAGHFAISRQTVELLEDLRSLGSPCVVVTSDEELNYRLPTQSDCLPYLPHGVLTVATNEELAWRFVFVRKLLGYDLASTARLLAPEPLEMQGRGWAFHLFKTASLGTKQARELVTSLWDMDVRAGLRRFRVDAVLVRDEEPSRVVDLENLGLRVLRRGSYGVLLSPGAANTAEMR